MTKRRMKKKMKIGIFFLISILLILGVGIYYAQGFNANEKPKEPAKKNKTEEPKEPIITDLIITFGGDATFANCCNGDSSAYDSFFNNNAGGDYGYYFSKIKYIFDESDYSIVNLEGVLSKDASKYPWNFPWGKYYFKGNPGYANILSEGGVNAASVANNHAYDYGEEGALDTINALKNVGVEHFGFDDILIKDIKGIKIAFIGFNYIDEPHSTKEDMERTINEAKALKPDYIFAYLHHYDNDSQGKYVASKAQRENAYWVLDQGVDMVIGTHAHVPQGVEMYNNKLIIHSTGHLSFGGNSQLSYWAARGLIAQIKLSFEDKKLTNESLKLIPIMATSSTTRNNYQPYVLTGTARQEVIDHVNKYSYNYKYID